MEPFDFSGAAAWSDRAERLGALWTAELLLGESGVHRDFRLSLIVLVRLA